MIGLVGTCGQVSRSIFSNKGLGFLTVLTSVSVCFLALNKREKCESIFCVCVFVRTAEERRDDPMVVLMRDIFLTSLPRHVSSVKGWRKKIISLMMLV